MHEIQELDDSKACRLTITNSAVYLLTDNKKTTPFYGANPHSASHFDLICECVSLPWPLEDVV
jgi:hypothetical protein